MILLQSQQGLVIIAAFLQVWRLRSILARVSGSIDPVPLLGPQETA